MKFTTLFAALVGMFFATGATAQSANLVEFRGLGYLTIQSDCTEFNWGDAGTIWQVNVRHRPANLRDNDNRDRLSIFFDFYAMSLAVEGKLNKKFKDTTSISVGSNGFFSDNPRTEAKLIKRDPGSIKGNTESMRIQVEYKNFDGLQGCRATLDAAMVRQPGR